MSKTVQDMAEAYETLAMLTGLGIPDVNLFLVKYFIPLKNYWVDPVQFFLKAFSAALCSLLWIFQIFSDLRRQSELCGKRYLMVLVKTGGQYLIVLWYVVRGNILNLM